MKTKLLCLALTIIFCAGCKTPEAYHFFVAGHVYGSPSRKAVGLHPPFVQDFDYLRSDSLLRFGVFTGDIVYYSRDTFF